MINSFTVDRMENLVSQRCHIILLILILWM